MGGETSRENYLEKEKQRLQKRITLRFLGFKETDTKFLEMQEEMNNFFGKIPDLVEQLASFTGLPQVISPILTVINSVFMDSSIETSAMLELKIEKDVVTTVHVMIEAEVKSIERQLGLINNEELSIEDKKARLIAVDDSCYKLLLKFSNEKFYLKKYSLVFAPFLMSFVALYVPIAIANYKINGTNQIRKDCEANMEKLNYIMEYFKEQSVKERLQYIERNFRGGENSYILDYFLEDDTVLHILFFSEPEIFGEVHTWYRDKVTTVHMKHIFNQD